MGRITVNGINHIAFFNDQGLYSHFFKSDCSSQSTRAPTYDNDFFNMVVQKNQAEKNKLYSLYQSMNMPYIESHTNFVYYSVAAYKGEWQKELEKRNLLCGGIVEEKEKWTRITIGTEAEMKGVLADGKSAAANAAKKRGLPDGHYAILNTRSAADPVLTFAANRALREKVWREFTNRGDNGDGNDTNATIAKIVKLRADRAHLLGFPTHAHWRMENTMAKDPAKAMDLMMRVWKPAVARVHQEVAEMKPIAAKDGIKTIEPWDYRYYMEKLRKAKYDLSQEELKPYFKLDHNGAGMHWAGGEPNG